MAETLAQGLERFRIAYQSGLARDIEPLGREAVVEGEQLVIESAALREVAHWAQAVLTAWNGGDMAKESLLHKKLREVMIHFRNRIGASGATVWLIERGQFANHTPTIWWCGGDARAGVGEDEMLNWTEDALKARRFADQGVAADFAKGILADGTYAITEHIFLGGQEVP